MRDPLSFVPVRYKLPLTFGLLCVVAFGLGGYVVTTTARDALERQIRLRLDERAANTHLVVDQDLELLGRRVEDFASDGHIRLELERLQASPPAATDELVRHLRTNKLALVKEFVDAYVLDRDGEVLVRAYSEADTPSGFHREGFWYGPLRAPSPEHPYPTFVLSTPVTALDGGRRVGYLQIVVRADVWAVRLHHALSHAPLEDLRIELSGVDGYRLPLVRGAGATSGPPEGAPDGGGEDPGRLTFSSTNDRTGWKCNISVDRRILTLPVSTLVSTFVYTGIGLAALTMLLILPSRQFLLKPLSELENAARKITGGDFSTRVGYQSGDEVGHLSEAFDVMAGATEERTRRLAQAAEDLCRREAEIRFERDRLNTVIQSMEDGLFILDREGRTTLANAAAEKVLRELGKGRRGHSSQDCGHGERTPRSCLACLGSYERPVEPCVVTMDGRTYDIHGTSLRDSRGEEAGRVFVSRDVTERMHQAAQQAHQERMLVLGEIAAVMAHEMNNPLAAISMFSQMLLDGLDDSSPLYTHAEVVHRNTLSCKRTIRSLLDMATTSPSHPETFDVRDLVDDVVEFLRPVAERGRATLNVDAEANEGLVHGDEIQLRQALINLVMNAIQACESAEKGVVMVGTLDRDTPDRGEEVVIRVRDKGPGIPEKLREHVFEPFFTTKPAGEGTGLGLPTTRRIVEAQGGRLILCPGSGAGTTLEIVLPRHRRAPAEALVQAVAAEGPA